MPIGRGAKSTNKNRKYRERSLTKNIVTKHTPAIKTKNITLGSAIDFTLMTLWYTLKFFYEHMEAITCNNDKIWFNRYSISYPGLEKGITQSKRHDR